MVTGDHDLVRLAIVPSEMEAEILRGLLEAADIPSMQRPTNFAAGALDGATSAGGAREVLVHRGNLERARELTSEQ